MTTLHIVNSRAGLRSCAQILLPGDEVLLIEDGVYTLLDRNLSEWMRAGHVTVHALADDMLARGVSIDMETGVHRADMSDFVSLCIRTEKSVSWF